MERRSRFLGLGLCLFLALPLGCSSETTTPIMIDGGGVDGGGGDGSTRDTGPRPDGGGALCGNNEEDPGEECDDGNAVDDDGCTDCRLDCGDGAVSGDETCDPGIAAGEEGACPTDCDDGMSCTSDALEGAGCNVSCSHGDITLPASGDGCCPPSADATIDDDCAAVCGNGILEIGELCDTDIGSGAGACPTSCDDAVACTTDALSDGGTCNAVCTNTAITTPAAGDGCCPAGATAGTDSDCSASCGDGVVSAGETCDTAIASGAGSCPTTCSDGMSCTRDMLTGSGCNASCAFTPITAPMAGDGCCPPGATIATDSDCAARCGDGIVSAPEACDDGNVTSGDGCSATCTSEARPTAIRMTDLDIRDPHLFASVAGCQDVTNTILGFIDGVNPMLQAAITTDDDGDGDLDLSVTEIFSPLVQTAGGTTPTYVSFPTCTTPMASTMCTLPAGGTRTTPVTATSQAGTTVCVAAIAGSTRGSYTPALVFPTASGAGNCYAADIGALALNLGGLPITLQQATVGGEWIGTPATGVRDGVIRGFLTYAQARSTIVPAGLTGQAAIDGHPISDLLRTTSTTGATAGACGSSASASDLDMGPDGSGGTVPGWWFYLNFSATVRPYSEL